MNLLLDLNVIETGVFCYDSMMKQLNEAITSVRGLQEGITKDVWHGKGRNAFDKALKKWIDRTNIVISEIVQTRESLTCAGSQGNELRQMCEGFEEP